MPSLYLHVPPLGIDERDGFTYRGDRPAAHCGICGASYQPAQARDHRYETDWYIQYVVERKIDEWRHSHNNSHSEKEHLDLQKSGNLMTPVASLKLIPLGIYPLQDMVMDEEVQQAALEAKRAPSDDVAY